MCQDKKARAEYLSREMALHDEATRIEEAMEEGLEKGIVQGIEQGIEQGREELINLTKKVFKLVNAGESISNISKLCGISEDEVREILE